MSIYAGTRGYLDGVPRRDVAPLRGGAARVVPHPPRRPARRIRSGAIGDEALRRGVKASPSSSADCEDGRSSEAQAARRAASSSTTWSHADDGPAGRGRSPRRPTEPWRAARSGSSAGGSSSVQSTKKITQAMELIAASRIVKAQQRVAAARPYSEQITEVIRNLAAGGAGVDHPLLRQRERRAPVGYVVLAADRGLAGGYNSTRHPRHRARDHGRPSRGPRLRARHDRQEGRRLLPVPPLRDRRALHRHHRQAHLRGRPPGRRARSPSAFESGDVDQVELVYTAVPVARHPARSCAARSCRSTTGRRAPRRPDGTARRRRRRPSYEFEPVGRGDPRPTAAPLRRGPAVRRAARGGRVRARQPASGP